MRTEAAMSKINPQAMEMDDQSRGTLQVKDASYSDALGFVSSCHGVSCLAHYSLLANGEDTVSRKACAREVRKKLSSIIPLQEIEDSIELFVNSHIEEYRVNLSKVDDDVYHLLCVWQDEWMTKLGAVDREY